MPSGLDQSVKVEECGRKVDRRETNIGNSVDNCLGLVYNRHDVCVRTVPRSLQPARLHLPPRHHTPAGHSLGERHTRHGLRCFASSGSFSSMPLRSRGRSTPPLPEPPFIHTEWPHPRIMEPDCPPEGFHPGRFAMLSQGAFLLHTATCKPCVVNLTLH